MEISKTITDKDIFSQLEFLAPKKYQKRVTVKAIVENEKGEVAFVTNPIHNFILLPGGGAESKNLKKEIDRECQEEIFYSLKEIQKINKIRELRNRNSKEYETTCFSAKINQKSEKDTRTEDEKNNGLSVMWLPKEDVLVRMESQMEKLNKGGVKFYNTAFDIFRDYYFFKKFLEK